MGSGRGSLGAMAWPTRVVLDCNWPKRLRGKQLMGNSG